MATLAELLSTMTVTEIFENLLAVYSGNGFPVQSWQVGGVERTRLMAFATALADISGNYIPTFTAGGFLGYATGDWLRLLTEQNYLLPYKQAQRTRGIIILTNVSTQPYTIAAGDLIAAFGASGNRYINYTGNTLPASSQIGLLWEAEFAGSQYNDPSSSGNLTLVTPLPGVSISNPAAQYEVEPTVKVGTGSLILGGSPVGTHSVRLRIDATAGSAPVALSYSIDGAPYVFAGIVSSLTNLGGLGIDVTLEEGVSGTSWAQGDIHAFHTPGNWIFNQGTDDETDAALTARARARWSSLSPVPVSNFYHLLVTTMPGTGQQVTTVIVQPDTVVSAQVNIVVAGPFGVLSPSAIAEIQEYVTARVPGTERAVVLSPTIRSVTIAGAITCKATLVESVQAGVETALINYIDSVGINGTVRIAAIIDVIMDVEGVVDVTGITINGVAANLILPVVANGYEFPDLQPLAFTYPTV
jgi:hypothetical protein